MWPTGSSKTLTCCPEWAPQRIANWAQESWKKTEDELRRNIADGPFMSFEEVPLDCPCFVIRKGIWEQHGTATEPSCRNIDDFLISGQNETAGYCSVHIPATVDSLVAQTRSVQDRFPREPLLSWTSDFAKAYRQVPQHPSQVSMTVIAQWHPGLQQVVFVVPYAQPVGGRTLHCISAGTRHGSHICCRLLMPYPRTTVWTTWWGSTEGPLATSCGSAGGTRQP